VQARLSYPFCERSGTTEPRRFGQLAAEVGVVALAYLLIGRLSLLAPLASDNLPLIWPPAGLATAIVLLRGRVAMIGVATGAFLTVLSTGAPWGMALAALVGMPLQASLARILLRRWRFDPHFLRFTDATQFLVLGAGIPPLASALAAAFGLCLTGLAPWSAFPAVAGESWLSAAVGTLLFCPAAFAIVSPVRQPREGGKTELALLFLLLGAVSLIFYGGLLGNMSGEPLSYIGLPFVLWAIKRFGLRATAASLVTMVAAAMWGVARGKGIFAGPHPQHAMLYLDGYFGTVGGLFLLVTAAVVERRAVRAGLTAAKRELERRVEAGTRNLAAAGARLAERDTRFQVLADTIPQLVWMATPDGHAFWYNQRWYDYTGTSLRMMQRNGWQQVHHPEHVERVLAGFQRSLDSGEPWQDTFPLRGRSGEFRWFLSRAVPVWSPDGKISMWFGTNTDVTEQFEVEAKLQAAKTEAEAAREQAERANAAKSTFLASASHDLRQPVQSLMLLLNVLEVKLDGHPARDVLEHLTNTAQAMQQLLDSLLDISRLDAGVVQPKPQLVRVDEMLAALAEEYRPHAAENGLRMKLVSWPATTDTDPTLLDRILRNLIENAIRYTRRGGILLACRVKADEAQVDVVDTGEGIPEEHLQNIFDEFFQVGNPSRDRAKGLGLGLSVVKRLAHMLGMQVTVNSVEGRGSHFSLTMQRVVHVAPPAPAQSLPPSSLQGLAVVIDDEVLLRTGLRLLLDRWGLEVIDVATGAEAVDRLIKAGRRVPDLVIADYRLAPGITGLDAVDQIIAQVGRPRQTFILTGDMAPERMAEVEFRGHRLLHKPIMPDQLRRALAPALQPTAAA
jgi:PAS domain S-box-containing protein